MVRGATDWLLLLVLWCAAWSVGHSCVVVSQESCPPIGSACRCQRNSGDLVVCCYIRSPFQLKEGLNCARVRENTRKVSIHNATLSTFDADLDDWKHLQSLSVTNGQIQRIQGKFVGALSCVNFTNNNITEVTPNAFAALRHLKVLDLSKNNITKIPNVTVTRFNLTLDVSNNSYMWCNSILELMVRYQNTSRLSFQNQNDTNCLSVASFHWFNSTDAMKFSQLELMTKGLNEDCPSQCTCRTYRADFTPMHPVQIKLNVNCSNQHLTELPPLPPNTIYLDVSNNEITSIKALGDNDSYSEIREFIADNNKIESISVLEGSRFIDNFAILSLRNNKIKSIPTYILSNAFDRTFHENRIVKIGGNRLQCDCSTAQVKMWMLNNKNYIPDHDEVLCDKAFERVIDIDPSKICVHVHEKDWTDYIYYIIAVEIVLLVSLISKVVYDYWVFKSFGYLPWPASHMPKLPCDWCFET